MAGSSKFFSRTLSMGPPPKEVSSANRCLLFGGRASSPYRRLERSASYCGEERAPKGYVPVLVGKAEAEEERVLVHVSVLKAPTVSALLDAAAQEFGYSQDGILRVLCDSDDFRRIVNDRSKLLSTREENVRESHPR